MSRRKAAAPPPPVAPPPVESNIGLTRISTSTARRGRYAKTQRVADVLLYLVNERFADIPLSTRQTFYAAVVNKTDLGAIPNTKQDYNRVQRLLVELRREGEIDDARIVDRTRSMHKLAAWDGPRQLLRDAGLQFRRDAWKSQPTIAMIGLEKQALEAVAAHACDESGASLWVTRGYASESFSYEWAGQIRHYYDHGHRVAITFFSDHDPSGLDLERHARESLLRHLGDDADAIASWTRGGLLTRDFRTYDVVNVKIKRGDSRARAYVARYGQRAGELDALPPDVLQRRIRDAIQASITDSEAWDGVRREEALQRESFDMVSGYWDAALQGARVASGDNGAAP